MTKFLYLPLLLLLLALPGCAVPRAIGGRSTAQLTTPGVQALHTLEVVKLLDVIRDTANDGEGLKVIAPATNLKVAIWHKDLIRVIRASAQGWKAAVIEALERLRKDLTLSEDSVLGPYIQAAIATAKAVL